MSGVVTFEKGELFQLAALQRKLSAPSIADDRHLGFRTFIIEEKCLGLIKGLMVNWQTFQK